MAEKAGQVDGAIGELLQFHETYGYYAQSVSVVSKLVAHRWKDRDFASALFREGLVDANVVLERIDLLPDVSPALKERLHTWVNWHS